MTTFPYVEFHTRAKMASGASFLQGVIPTFPYRIHTLLTDNGGMALASLPARQLTCATSVQLNRLERS